VFLFTEKYCKGDVIFEDNFDTFNFDTWEHENTLAGGGNWEFQWYTNNRSNSFVENGVLNIRPTLTSDELGDAFLTSGTLSVHGGDPSNQCTNQQNWGCERSGNVNNIINPVKSARLRTANSFAFKYGKVEISAKMPTGDWLWPAIWFLPKSNNYGRWPASGEIDLVESRGNRDLTQNGVNIGVKRMGSTLHYGPYSGLNGYLTSTYSGYSDEGFNNGFHKYQMEWTPEKMTFSVDDEEIGTVGVGSGFWNRGDFESKAPGTDDPWRYASKMAPFDQEFYMIINLAVGGVAYFPDDTQNPVDKPWSNFSPKPASDFWNGRDGWLPTWKLDDKNSNAVNFQIDYVKVYAL
jgi:beta-glucanase (GH16 family)